VVVAPPTPPVTPAPTVGVASWAASDLTKATVKPSSGPQTFSKPPGKGVERLKVGYRMVRLSEGVDDVSSRELGRLDRGDEVEVLDSWEGFLQVRTPDGVTGWIPRHTILG
jgi:Bacterial SH3 domain